MTNIILNTIEEKRDFLRKLSGSVSDLLKSGEFDTVNEAVISTYYKDETHAEFKTFNQWKADGYRIKKGSKAFLVWGKPKRVQDAEAAQQQGKEAPTDDTDQKDFYPLAFLFSNAQVELKGEKQNV